MSLFTLLDPATLAVFMAAGVALNVTPGSDVMFVTACGASQGWKAGIAAAAGISSGTLVHIALTAGGMAAVMQAHPGALEIVKWIGAVYLVWLAVRLWNADPARTRRAAQGLRAAFAKGALTNILNPKVALFILAFLPQFTDPARGPVAAQMVVLGLLFAASGLVINGAYGAAAGALAAPMRRHARALNRFSALVFGGLAARLVLD